MKLYAMSESEYALWAPRSRLSYAADKMRANGLTRSEAEKIATDDFNRLLPEGLGSKNHFLYSAKDESQNVIGFIWFCVLGADANRRAYIYDVIIEEAYRGQGYGKKMMTLVEKEIQALGIQRVGLHVFGYNETAIRLYSSLGYATTDLVMEKTLSV